MYRQFVNSLKKLSFESNAIIGTTLRSMSSQSIGNKLLGRVAIVTASTEGLTKFELYLKTYSIF
jgi:hypothetical protein